MSIPISTTVFGQITIDDLTFDLLTQPLSDSQFEKIKQFKKDNNCGISSAPWSVNKYKWILEDDKLHLVDVRFKLCEDKSNNIQNIFDTDKLFASWLNKELKVLIHEIPEYNNPNKKREKKRKVLMLKFKDGVIISKNEIEEIYTSNRLQDYIES
ncbi:MAG: hypothetical protein AB7I39_13165 [Arcobacter sp.]